MRRLVRVCLLTVLFLAALVARAQAQFVWVNAQPNPFEAGWAPINLVVFGSWPEWISCGGGEFNCYPMEAEVSVSGSNGFFDFASSSVMFEQSDSWSFSDYQVGQDDINYDVDLVVYYSDWSWIITYGNQLVQVNPPSITGTCDTVWWFNGEHPSNYDVSCILISTGASPQWSVTQGANLVVLSDTTGTTTTVTASGTEFSQAVGDIRIQVTASGKVSDPFRMTVRRPASLADRLDLYQTNCGTYQGDPAYSSQIYYEIRDSLGTNLPSAVEFTEAWTSPKQDLWPGGSSSNWYQPTPSGSVSGQNGQPGHIFFDGLSVVMPGPSIPTISCGSSAGVMFWGQAWFIGSTTPGHGVTVQQNSMF